MKNIDPLFQSLASTANIIHDNAIIGYFAYDTESKKERLKNCRFYINQLIKSLKEFNEANQGEHND